MVWYYSYVQSGHNTAWLKWPRVQITSVSGSMHTLKSWIIRLKKFPNTFIIHQHPHNSIKLQRTSTKLELAVKQTTVIVPHIVPRIIHYYGYDQNITPPFGYVSNRCSTITLYITHAIDSVFLQHNPTWWMSPCQTLAFPHSSRCAVICSWNFHYSFQSVSMMMQ